MKKAKMTGFSLRENNKEPITKVTILYKEHVEYYFWDLAKIPKKGGVYIVYDIVGDCLYVGSTPYRFDVNYRVSEHLKKANFRDYGHKILFFETQKDTEDILLLEKLFSKALGTPPFNKERSFSLTKTGLEYLRKNKNLRNYKSWRNFDEREARSAGVPIYIVKLRDKIEEKYDFIEELPFLRGKVNLNSLYSNMIVYYEKYRISIPSATLEDWIDSIMSFIDEDILSDVIITKMLLVNKQYIWYMKDQKKKSKVKRQ
jgi:GIY-YIG catalytic domain